MAHVYFNSQWPRQVLENVSSTVCCTLLTCILQHYCPRPLPNLNTVPTHFRVHHTTRHILEDTWPWTCEFQNTSWSWLCSQEHVALCCVFYNAKCRFCALEYNMSLLCVLEYTSIRCMFESTMYLWCMFWNIMRL